MKEIYICQESFLVPDIDDDDGRILETSTEIKVGTLWEKEENKYRMCENPHTIRLENENQWLELLPENFSKYFKLKERTDV